MSGSEAGAGAGPGLAPGGADSGVAGASLLVRMTIHRPVGVLMLFVALVVVGVIAYPRIRMQLLPDGLASGHCGVYVPVRDGTPREVMEQIAKPCEDYLRTLPGLKSVISRSGANHCFFRLEFDPRYDMTVMVTEVRDRIDRAKSSWPEGVDRYHIWRHDESDIPAYVVSLGLDVDEEAVDVDHLFDEVIAKRIEAVAGVARVHVWGLLDKRVEISIDKDRVQAHGVDLRSLIERLVADNVTVTAGSVREGDREFLVRVDGKFRSFEEIMEYPVDERFKVRDIARVGYVHAVRDRISRVNGQLAKVIVVYKESGANAVEVCGHVEKVLGEIREELERTVPGLRGIESHAWMNQGEMIRVSVDSLKTNGLWGALLAVAVLFLFFRRVGMTLLVTLAIPASLTITVVWLFFAGRSFNLMSLMGLSLSIGMLVDNSIVIVENILRKLEGGLAPRDAATEGVREVGLAVSLATLTTLMVFLPIIFLGDPRFQAVAAEIGLPLCVSVLGSLLVALVFVPQGAVFLQGLLGRLGPRGQRPGRASLANRFTTWALGHCLRHRLAAFLAAGALLATTRYAFERIPKEPVSTEGPRRLEMRLELPKNFTLGEANETFATVEEAVRKAGGDLGIRSITSWFDAQGGEVGIFLEPGVRIKEKEFFARIEPGLPRLPGVVYHLGFEDFVRDEGSDRVRVFIEGNDYDRLEEAAALVTSLLENRELFPELEPVTRWQDEEREEVRIEVNRRAAQHQGVDTALVSRMVSWALRGAPLADYVVADREYPFWIRYADAEKENVEEVREIQVYRADGMPVRLDSVATYSLAAGTGEIHRRDGRMTVGLSARAQGGDVEVLRRKARYHVSRLDLPEGCEADMRPPLEGFQQDMESTQVAMALAMFLVFFVMGVLFESWVLPLSVLLSIPFAFFGAIWFLLAVGITLDGVGMIGLLMLVGIVVNNAIVLVDYINRLHRGGLGRSRAILLAAEVRFRPIWMTALTTISGLLPLLVLPQRGEGVDYKALAAVLVGGLAVSTFFTLLVVPLLYTVLDDLRRLGGATVR